MREFLKESSEKKRKLSEKALKEKERKELDWTCFFLEEEIVFDEGTRWKRNSRGGGGGGGRQIQEKNKK